MPAADPPLLAARAPRALAPVTDDNDGGGAARSADPRWLLPLLFLGSVALYTVGTSLFFASGAGGHEIALAQRAEWIFRPQHLFGTALLRLWLQLGAAVGIPLPPVALANLLNLLLAGAAVTLTYILLRRLALGRAPALLAALVLAVSNALWEHATTGEAVVMALPFALAALALAAGKRHGDGRTAGDRTIGDSARGLLATALFCLSIILGAQMALLLPALLVLVARQAAAGARAVAVARASALAIVLGLGPFLLVAVATEGGQNGPTFFNWLFARTDGEALAPVTGGPLQLARAIAGIGRLIFSPSDGESALRALLTGDRAQLAVGDRLSLLRNLLAALTLLALALRGTLILRRRSPALALGLALPVLAVATLGTWWLSSEPALWLPVFPLLLGLAAFGAAPTAPWSLPVVRRWSLALPAMAAAALVLSLGASNRCRQAPSLLCGQGGPEWRAAAQVARATTGADLVMGPTGSELMWLPHLRPAARTLQFDQAIPQSVDAVDYLGEIWAAVQDTLASGGRVYVQGLADPLPARLTGAWVSMHSKHGVSRQDLRRLLDREFHRRPAPALGPAVEELLPRQMLAEAQRLKPGG